MHILGTSDTAVHLLGFPDIYRCPACGESLTAEGAYLRCGECAQRYPISDNIPQLFVDNEWASDRKDVTRSIREFYEETPFPDYDDLDDSARLMDKARRGLLARLLDDQLPVGCRVLEAGCGTGQLSNFLSLANRTVFGTDLSLSSLALAEDFRRRNKLDRVQFLQMNLFRPCFREETFDAIVSNGVLHHTSDPRLALAGLARLLKPGGHLIVGLYHRYGRLATDLRRILFSLAGDRFRFLDSRAVDGSLGENRKRAWFEDQYHNPHESKHTIRKVAAWLDPAGLRFVRSLPSTLWQSPGGSDAPNLFEEEPLAVGLPARLKEMSMALWPSQIREGGFFVIVAVKPG